MAKYVIEDTTLTNTANAIREKTGGTEPITPSNFATEIEGIQSGGSTVTKGLVINEYDEEGYPIDASIIGITELPSYFLYSYTGRTSGNYTKYGYFKNLNTLKLPENITTIPDYFAYGCSSLNIDKIPNDVTSIGKYAFFGCSLYNSPKEMPSSVTTIKENSFAYSSITELTVLSNNLTLIENYAFYQSSITTIKFPNITSVPTLGTNVFGGSRLSKGGIYVPDDLVESFKSATNWSSKADQIKPISELEASA